MCTLKSPMSANEKFILFFFVGGGYGPPPPPAPLPNSFNHAYISIGYGDICMVETVVFNGYLMPCTEWKYCL